jgi:hypothetical protein
MLILAGSYHYAEQTFGNFKIPLFVTFVKVKVHKNFGESVDKSPNIWDNLAMGELQNIVSQDKRRSDRIPVSLNIYFSLPSSASAWQGPLFMQDLSGHGLRFLSPRLIRKSSRLNLKIELPGLKSPIICKGEVSWTKKDISKNAYHIGARFDKMATEDRQQFVRFIFQELLKRHPELG